MIFLGLGSNLGDKQQNLQTALAKLAEHKVVIQKVSSTYETKPWGYTQQDDFLNLVAQVHFEGTAQALLNIALQVEVEMGRVREIKWGPRLIDIDLLEFHRQIIQTEVLTLPHPLYTQRDFVMQPLQEIAPDWQPTTHLLTAYQQTLYEVTELNFTLKIGQINAALDAFLQKEQLKTWAFLTAWNPYSQLLPLLENQRRNQQLRQQLAGYTCWEGWGKGEDGLWEAEESVFVTDISRETASKIGRDFQQNAIVWGEVFEPAQLIWLHL